MAGRVREGSSPKGTARRNGGRAIFPRRSRASENMYGVKYSRRAKVKCFVRADSGRGLPRSLKRKKKGEEEEGASEKEREREEGRAAREKSYALRSAAFGYPPRGPPPSRFSYSRGNHGVRGESQDSQQPRPRSRGSDVNEILARRRRRTARYRSIIYPRVRPQRSPAALA